MKKNVWLALLLGLLLGIGPVWAQEEAGAAGADASATGAEAAEEALAANEEEHGSVLDVVLRWLNAAVLFGGLGYLLRKPASEFFEARRHAIQDGLGRAQRAQEESDRKLADIEARLTQLSADAAQIQEDAKASSEAERERIVADGKLEVGRAMEQSRAEIERLVRGFEQEIRTHMADLVIDGATERLRAQISEDAQRRIIGRFVNEI